MKKKAMAIALALALTPAAGVAQDYDAGLAAYDRGDYATALQEWRPLAEQGDARAQNSLGRMYDTGDVVAQDYIEAARWYRMAAAQGYTSAQISLSWIYEQGPGDVPQDYVTAHMWANIALANGNEFAPEMLDRAAMRMTRADISEAERRAEVCMASDYQDCD